MFNVMRRVRYPPPATPTTPTRTLASAPIDPTEPMLPKTVENLHTELEKCDEEFDMMINLAGHYYPPNTQKVLKSLDIEIHPH